MGWFTLPQNNVVSGQAGHLLDHDDVYAGLLALMTAGLQGSFNVVSPTYGADPTGVADSTTAIQAAITAAAGVSGGIVWFPPGTYKISAALSPASCVRMTGPGRYAVTITSSASSIFNMAPGSLVDGFEVDHLGFSVTGFDLFTAGDCARCYIHDCYFVQNSAGNSIWSAPSAVLIEEVVWARNLEWVFGATRTVPAWNLGGGAINQCEWTQNVFWNKGADNTQYYFEIDAATLGTQNEGNVWRSNVFENPLGGMIRLKSTTRSVIEQCLAWDISATIQNSLIYLGEYAGNTSQPTKATTIVHSGKISTGYTFAAGASDIQLESTTVQTTIVNPVPSATINIAGATGVSIVGASTSMAVTASATTVAVGAGAGTGATASAAAGSDNRSGTITWNTGTSPSSGDQVNVTFGNPFAVTPTVMLTPLNGSTAGLLIAVESVTTTGFSVYTGGTPAASHSGYSVAWAAVSG